MCVGFRVGVWGGLGCTQARAYQGQAVQGPGLWILGFRVRVRTWGGLGFLLSSSLLLSSLDFSDTHVYTP